MAKNGHPNAREFFAGELRRARDRVKMSQDDLGKAVAYSPSTVAMVETGKRAPSRDFATRCDNVFDTDGLFERLSDLVNAEQAPEWFRPWLELEREAAGLSTWAPLIVQGLLQTEEYARAVLGSGTSLSEEELEQRVATRMARQEVLRRPNGPMIIAVFDEGALRRPIGGGKVMHDQLVRQPGFVM